MRATSGHPRDLKAAAMLEVGWEIASHGRKWIDYKDVPENVEREHMREAVRLHTEITGERPLGFLVGRPGRMASLERFLDYIAGHDRVWIARRIGIARHWQAAHPSEGTR